MSPRKLEIFQTALSLMKSKGYANTTMRDIASAVNMEAASLYNHIASKEDLLAITCFDLADQFEKGILEVNDIYFDAKEKLRMAIEAHTQILTTNLDASYVFLHEWKHLSAEKLIEFKNRRNQYENGFIEILKLGENEGVFNEVDEKFVVITILSTLNATIEWYKPNGAFSQKQVANKLSDFILNGLLNIKN